ncbi:MAG: DUF3459 domain-containing protein, partial [Actinomadura rubrobrunea]|nr:DUF3459 domain-containing protein [Actinomadura rubrobrunea]
PPGALVFSRDAADPAAPRLTCAVNMGGRTVRVPAHGRPLLASGPIRPDGDCVVLPPDTAVWCEAEPTGGGAGHGG